MGHILESKTNALLILFAAVALAVTFIAAIVFGQQLWNEFFDFLKIEVGGAVTRAATNDGLPKAVEAYSKYARPPSLPPEITVEKAEEVNS